MTVTYERLIEIFRDIQDRHHYINDFGTGEAADIATTANRAGDSATEGDGDYPLLWVERHHLITMGIRTWDYRIAFYMITNSPGIEPGQDAEVAALSTMLEYVNHVFEMLRVDYPQEITAVSPNNGIADAVDVTNVFTDNTYGWRVEVLVSTPRPAKCPIPADPIVPPVS